MRVTGNTYNNTLLDQLSKLTDRQTRLQTQVATGQRIQQAADDPTAMNRVLAAESESKSLAQYQNNINSLKDQATAVYSAINTLKNISNRAGEIAVSADGTKSVADLKNLGTEVSQLIRQAVQTANSQAQGDYLFAGTQTSQPPFVITADANGVITQVKYQGNDQVNQAEIGSHNLVSAQVPGANSSNSGPNGLLADTRTGADFFQHLIDLQNHLLNGQVDAIAKTDRSNLGLDETNIINQISANGVLQAQLDTAADFVSQRQLDLQKTVSRNADADLAETITRLNQTQVAYQAALQTGSLLLQHSLLDYLR